MAKPDKGVDPEIAAISAVYAALQGLGPESQQRVLDYVARKLGLTGYNDRSPADVQGRQFSEEPAPAAPPQQGAASDDLGISPVAVKWMRRNGLTPKALGKVFSLGVDEIDLVAQTVPGKSLKQRMQSVFLLKGVAQYLSSGVARIPHDQVKEACLHYDAYDATNFSKYLKSFSSEVSGTKETGYSLTARGMSTATDLVKSMSS